MHVLYIVWTQIQKLRRLISVLTVRHVRLALSVFFVFGLSKIQKIFFSCERYFDKNQSEPESLSKCKNICEPPDVVGGHPSYTIGQLRLDQFLFVRA